MTSQFTLFKYYKMMLLIIAFEIICMNVCESQEIIRQNLGCLGFNEMNNGVFVRQSIGQSSNTEVISNSQDAIRQGFQQPMFLKLKENEDNKFSVVAFPNPFKESVFIDLVNIKSSAILEINDQNGKLIYYKKIEDGPTIEVNTSSWSSGIYILMVNNNLQTSYYKLIKIQ